MIELEQNPEDGFCSILFVQIGKYNLNILCDKMQLRRRYYESPYF